MKTQEKTSVNYFPDTWAKFLFLAVILATVLNGSCFWLKRVGWLEPEFRQEYYSNYHHDRDYVVSQEEREEVFAFRGRLFRPQGLELPMKLAKDGVVILFLIISLLKVKNHANRRKVVCRDWLVLAMFVTIGFAMMRSLQRYDPVVSLAGLRSFDFLFISLFGLWAVKDDSLDFLSKCLVALLLFQLLLVPVELWRGIHLFYAKFFGTDLGDRVVGTMLLPASLGIFSVVTLSLYVFFTSARHILWVGVCTIILIYFSGSATAWVMLFFLAGILVYRQLGPVYEPWIRTGGMLLLALGMAGLPVIVGRHDIFDSLWGRIYIFQKFIESDIGVVDVFFGRGLGAGTNALNNLRTHFPQIFLWGTVSDLRFPADSTPMALLHQVGLVGVVIFYGLLFRAAWRDRIIWPIYMIVGLASLTVNILELFPVNFLLGLLLARSLGQTRPSAAARTSRMIFRRQI